MSDRKGKKLLEDLRKDPDLQPLAALRTAFSPIEREALRDAKRIISAQEREIAMLKRAVLIQDKLSEVETPKCRRVKQTTRAKPVAYQLHLSDTHSREIVSLSHTDGRNEHNAEIGRERMRSVIHQAVDEMKKDSVGRQPVHCTVWGGGDWMVNADLHYKMERCVDDEPLVEMEFVYQMLQEELDHLFRRQPCDSVSFVGSFSNHGRDSEKMIPGLEAARSYDTAIYKRLKEDFTDVNFIIANTPWTVEDINGFKTMYTHGHVRKSNVARNTEGMMVPKWSFIRDMRTAYGIKAWVQGHHHVQCNLWSKGFCHMQNASLVGENSYSHSEGYPPEPPSQNLAVIDLEAGCVEKIITLSPSGKIHWLHD